MALLYFKLSLLVWNVYQLINYFFHCNFLKIQKLSFYPSFSNVYKKGWFFITCYNYSEAFCYVALFLFPAKLKSSPDWLLEATISAELRGHERQVHSFFYHSTDWGCYFAAYWKLSRPDWVCTSDAQNGINFHKVRHSRNWITNSTTIKAFITPLARM